MRSGPPPSVDPMPGQILFLSLTHHVPSTCALDLGWLQACLLSCPPSLIPLSSPSSPMHGDQLKQDCCLPIPSHAQSWILIDFDWIVESLRTGSHQWITVLRVRGQDRALKDRGGKDSERTFLVQTCGTSSWKPSMVLPILDSVCTEFKLGPLGPELAPACQ